MISRRDNLLVRPWMQKRYEDHRKKIQNAVPAIDNKPPTPRQHVSLKLKKKQREFERCQQIEKNNFNLLKRLSFVMRSNRVDHYWKTPQPNFLNRVTMFDVSLPNIEDLLIEDHDEEKIDSQEKSNRKSRCLACTPQEQTAISIPETRVPWEPDRKPLSKLRTKSVPPIHVGKKTENKVPRSAGNQPKKMPKLKSKEKLKIEDSLMKEPKSIILSRGCLKLSVNFPSDTLVQVQEGRRNKILMQNTCNCRNVLVKV